MPANGVIMGGARLEDTDVFDTGSPSVIYVLASMLLVRAGGTPAVRNRRHSVSCRIFNLGKLRWSVQTCPPVSWGSGGVCRQGGLGELGSVPRLLTEPSSPQRSSQPAIRG